MDAARNCRFLPRRPAITLTEMLVAMGVIGILVGLSFFMFAHAQKAGEHLNAQVAHAKARSQTSSAQSLKKKGTVRKPPPIGTALDNSYIVQFKPGTPNPIGQAHRLAQLCGGSVRNNYSLAFVGCALNIQPGTLNLLTSDRVVAQVVPNYIYHATTEVVPTGIRRIYVSPFAFLNSTPFNSKIRNATGGPSGPVGGTYGAVAVIDSGVDYTQPDLNVVFNKGFGQPDLGDPAMHGTHVAGIIAAMHNEIEVVGVAPGAPIWNLRVLDATGAGLGSEVVAALEFAAANANQISVINMSLGTPQVDPLQNAAATYCVSQGQVVCVAAGNSAVDASTWSPASATNVICVAALCDTDGKPGGLGPASSIGDPDDTFASFSNYGTTVTVIAPGEDILSTLPGDTLGLESGTSMATPHVSGLALRIRAKNYTGKIQNITAPGGSYLSPAAILQIMLNNVTENIPGIFDSRTYPLISANNY